MNVAELLGKTLKAATQNGVESIDFETADGQRYRMWHSQDCCESVTIDDVIGDLQDLVGSPLTMAEESTNCTDPRPNPDERDDSFTWTFYRFATVKGYVTIRWYGSSNGYYSESVEFEKVG
jgi:hypothetical protein